MKALRGANADTVIAKLNPIITGWAAYFPIGALDAHVWRLVYKWASFSHSNKSTRWVTARHFVAESRCAPFRCVRPTMLRSAAAGTCHPLRTGRVA